MLKKIGIRTLAMYESGFRTITTKNTAVHKPDDMKGIKFRVVNNPLNVATFKALGANPTPMPLSEVFTGLQQGTVDGQDNPIGNVVAFGFDKVQSYITLSHHQWAGHHVSGRATRPGPSCRRMCRRLFKKTAIETQNWERKEVNAQGWRISRGDESAWHDRHRVDADAETAMFQEKMKEVWDKYQAKIGEKLIKAAVDTQVDVPASARDPIRNIGLPAPFPLDITSRTVTPWRPHRERIIEYRPWPPSVKP